MNDNKCEHNINLKINTVYIDKSSKRLIFPEIFMGVCLSCNRSLKFIKVKDVFLEI